MLVLGAVICTQLWAGNGPRAADRPPRAATRIHRLFIGGSLMSLLQKLNSLCAMAHNIRATSIIIFIFVIFYFCQGSSAGGATKAVGQLTAPLCPGGAPDNSLAFQRRVSEPKERSVPKGRLRATSVLSRPFGTRVSVLASPALKRRAIARCPSGTKLPRPMPDASNRTRNKLRPGADMLARKDRHY